MAAPEEAMAAPEEAMAAPEEAMAAPEEAMAAPEEAMAAPEEAMAAPEEAMAAPEEAMAAPEDTSGNAVLLQLVEQCAVADLEQLGRVGPVPEGHTERSSDQVLFERTRGLLDG